MRALQLLAVAMLLASASLPLVAADYHVATAAPGAADTNPGTADKPWKTIAKAAATAQGGDTVFIHAGTYPEAVTFKNTGMPDKPLTFKPFADDAVVMDGADTFAADRWKLVPGSKAIYATPLEAEPGQVLVDGKPVYVKIDQTSFQYPFAWKLGTLGEGDRNRYQYDAKAKRLLLNLGDEVAKHVIRIPVRATAIALSPHSRLAGIQARHYVGPAFAAGGAHAVVEDCLATDCGAGVCIGGWDLHGVVVRRNTVIGSLGSGIFLQDRPTHALIEDNLAVRCTLNPAHEDCWIGSIKMNSASDSIFAHNVVLEAGNPDTVCGHDGWALWGDIDIVRVMYVGNTCANNKEAGIYVEYAMGDTRAYFNTSYRNGHGITCRQSQRGVFMRNLVLESKGSGLAVWGGSAPYSTTDNVFAHNLVRGCSPSIWLAIENPNFANYNTYWPAKDAVLAQGEAPAGGKTPQFKDIDSWRKATGQDLKSEVRDAQPEDVGLGTVTFRVPEAKDPSQVLMMVGNGGFEWEDPAGQNILPYFWRPGSGDGVDHKFPYAAYCGLEGGCEGLAYPGAGGTVVHMQDQADSKEPKNAHSGLRCVRIEGQKPAEICKQGLGFWTPSLPTREGDTYSISFFVRGKDIQPAAGNDAVAAFIEFTDSTGQHRQQVKLAPAATTQPGPVAGTFDWRPVNAELKVPAGAKRMRAFLGLLPAKGQLFLDDVTIKVK